MSTLYFNGRLTPQSSVQISVDEFDIQSEFFDGLGIFSAFDIDVSDIVFLDCFNSFSSPGTVNRYKVIQINNRNAYQINLRIKWDDIGAIVDPGEVVGSGGFISRSTSNRRLPFHAAPTVHTIPDYVIQYSRNNDLTNIIDPFMNKYVKNNTGVSIPAFSVLCWLDDGSVGLAEADIVVKSDIAGININLIADGEWGWIIKTGYIPGALTGLNAIPGAVIYLSEESGRMTLTAPVSHSSSIIKVGRAEPPSGALSSVANDLHMELEILAEP